MHISLLVLENENIPLFVIHHAIHFFLIPLLLFFVEMRVRFQCQKFFSQFLDRYVLNFRSLFGVIRDFKHQFYPFFLYFRKFKTNKQVSACFTAQPVLRAMASAAQIGTKKMGDSANSQQLRRNAYQVFVFNQDCWFIL